MKGIGGGYRTSDSWGNTNLRADLYTREFTNIQILEGSLIMYIMIRWLNQYHLNS